MRSEDFEPFKLIIEDLCAAFDRPCTDARVRVFFETLRHLNITDVKRSAESYRRNARKMPTPKDLMPERKYTAPRQAEMALPELSTWAIAANKILFAIAYGDLRRGFQSIGVWEKMPPNGWGLPLRLPNPVDLSRLHAVLAAKADYVRMAQEAEDAGQPWDTVEFNTMCRQGFEKLLGTPLQVAA